MGAAAASILVRFLDMAEMRHALSRARQCVALSAPFCTSKTHGNMTYDSKCPRRSSQEGLKAKTTSGTHHTLLLLSGVVKLVERCLLRKCAPFSSLGCVGQKRNRVPSRAASTFPMSKSSRSSSDVLPHGGIKQQTCFVTLPVYVATRHHHALLRKL